MAGKTNPTYLEAAGDPSLLGKHPPVPHSVADRYDGGPSNVDLGWYPYGIHYREHPHYIHRNFTRLEGMGMLTGWPSNQYEAQYVNSRAYDPTFQTQQFGHWHCVSNCMHNIIRRDPGNMASVMAGTS